jgi:hypothetical protein
MVMRQPHVDDFVRLVRDIPELHLHAGQVGVVRSTWCAPFTAYEVEFESIGLDHETRALVMAEQLEVEENGAHLATTADE